MKKMFIKSYDKKYVVKRYSWSFWLAVTIEIFGILFMTAGIVEIEIFHKFNPASFFLQIGGLLFVVGSFAFCKLIRVN